MLIDNGTKLRVLQFDNIYNRSFTILDNFTSVQILNQVSCVDFTKFAVRHGVALFRRLCDLQRCKQSEVITRGIISSIEQIRVPDWWCCLHDSAVASCDNDVKCVTLIVRCSLDMLYESVVTKSFIKFPSIAQIHIIKECDVFQFVCPRWRRTVDHAKSEMMWFDNDSFTSLWIFSPCTWSIPKTLKLSTLWSIWQKWFVTGSYIFPVCIFENLSSMHWDKASPVCPTYIFLLHCVQTIQYITPTFLQFIFTWIINVWYNELLYV
jgi:hypothetical protein